MLRRATNAWQGYTDAVVQSQLAQAARLHAGHNACKRRLRQSILALRAAASARLEEARRAHVAHRRWQLTCCRWALGRLSRRAATCGLAGRVLGIAVAAVRRLMLASAYRRWVVLCAADGLVVGNGARRQLQSSNRLRHSRPAMLVWAAMAARRRELERIGKQASICCARGRLQWWRGASANAKAMAAEWSELNRIGKVVRSRIARGRLHGWAAMAARQRELEGAARLVHIQWLRGRVQRWRTVAAAAKATCIAQLRKEAARSLEPISRTPRRASKGGCLPTSASPMSCTTTSSVTSSSVASPPHRTKMQTPQEPRRKLAAPPSAAQPAIRTPTRALATSLVRDKPAARARREEQRALRRVEAVAEGRGWEQGLRR